MRSPLLFLTLIGLIPGFLFSQTPVNSYYLSNTPRFLNQFNDTLPNAFVGGLRNPQVYNIDLNKNGVNDLVIFEGRDKRFLTFTRSRTDKGQRFTHAPEYESRFPFKTRFEALKVRDYNDDGLKDLFINNSGSLTIFRQNRSDSLSFTKVKDEVMARDVVFCPDTCQSRIFTPPTDIPGIGDVDQDGDLDIISFSSNFIGFYRNLASERADLTSDSLVFEFTDGCWGSFQESGAGSNLPDIGIDCPDFRRPGKKHAGANLNILNVDGDRDSDVIYGDVGFDNLVLARNGKAEAGYSRDTFTAVSATYPASRPVDLQEFPAAFRPELSGDSVRDLLVTPQEELNGRTKSQLWYYKNTGGPDSPIYTYQNSNFLQRTMVDLGGGTAPVFFDYNGDGVKDLLVAANRNTGTGGSFLVLYENKGTDAKPVYKQRNNNYLNLKGNNLQLLRPAVGDLNGDGASDLVLGNSQGTLRYYRNQAEADQRASFQLVSQSLDGIDVGRGSAPAIGDVNDDGRADLVVGSSFRDLFYYRQENAGSGPTFTAVTDSFGSIQEKRFSYLAPRLADLNQNDSLDMILGTLGGIQLYPDFQARVGASPFPASALNLKVPGTSASYRSTRQLGNFLYPAVHSQGSDRLPDVMLGNGRGGLIYLGTQPQRDTIADNTGLREVTRSPPSYQVYPNPARDRINVSMTGRNFTPGVQMTFQLHNLKGQVVKRTQWQRGKGPYRIDVASIAPGLYISTLRSGRGTLLGRQRIVINP